MAESRVDYISDHLGIVKEEVISIINLLRDERILADQKDLTAYINRVDKENRSLTILRTAIEIEKCLIESLTDGETAIHIKEINEHLELRQCKGANPNKIRTLIKLGKEATS